MHAEPHLKHFPGTLLRLLSLCLLMSVPLRAVPDTRKVADLVGRPLEVPREIHRVYATSPIAIMMLYSLAPDKMVGWNYELGEAEKHFILPSVRSLPALGGWFGENGKGNRETLLAARPDVILSIGNTDRTAVDFAERLQEQVRIPVYVGSGRLEDSSETLEKLGELLGVPERGRLLADYGRKALADARAFAASLPREAKVRVYYAEGLRGVQTDSKGSLHTEVIDWLGAENVAEGPSTSGFGRMSTSLDRIIAWRPDVIIVCPEKGSAGRVELPEWLGDPIWRSVKAVAEGRVYMIPPAPFNLLDRPPSAARLLGLKWLAWVLYPERVTFDMAEEMRTFYRLFYNYEMSAAEARDILESSKPRLAKP